MTALPLTQGEAEPREVFPGGAWERGESLLVPGLCLGSWLAALPPMGDEAEPREVFPGGAWARGISLITAIRIVFAIFDNLFQMPKTWEKYGGI